jgi:uncharacterized protein YicC (UPF0701 family)
MTFASMTGFAESAGGHEGLRWRWEAKSVNSRSLDLRLRIPPGFDGLEPPVRRLAGERFLRVQRGYVGGYYEGHVGCVSGVGQVTARGRQSR